MMLKTKHTHLLILTLCSVVPLGVSAQTLNLTYANTYIHDIIFFINTYLVPLFIAVAFIFFLYGIVNLFFIKSESAQKDGPKYVLWGVIGFVVIFSVWGLVGIVSTTLGLGQAGSTAPAPPTFNTSNGASTPTPTP